MWAAAVTEGQHAVERGAFPEARDAFARAEAARPGTASVKDGLARLEAAEKASALGSLHRAAQEARAREDWKGALAAYDSAQRLEPAVAFAVEGRVEAAIRQALDEQLAGYLGRPDRLSAEAVAREAEIALDRAVEIEAPGPRLTRQIADLRAALAAARTTVAVRLVSDGLTDVTLLRGGRLGVFKAKTVELRPGAYVIVGTRKGYRDARVAFEVSPGGVPEPVRVRCDEAL